MESIAPMSAVSDKAAIERAMRAVQREFFVPPDQRSHADEDAPLPIGYAQTISQPSLVQFMTEQLRLTPHVSVLEVGTGSGFQTAILAELAREVYTIERIPQLAQTGRDRLGKLGYRNIHFRIGDGALGWPEAAPFPAIVVTAAAHHVPPALLDQLARGGRLVAPIGEDPNDQVLVAVTKRADGSCERQELCGVRFVPLISATQP